MSLSRQKNSLYKSLAYLDVSIPVASVQHENLVTEIIVRNDHRPISVMSRSHMHFASLRCAALEKRKKRFCQRSNAQRSVNVRLISFI